MHIILADPRAVARYTYDMSPFSLRSSRSKPIAIADIQSGSVSIAIALAHRDKPIEIVAVGRSDLSFENRAADATITALAEQIADAGKKALGDYAELQKTHGPVGHICAVINTPWVRSQTIRTISKLDTETLVTEQMITDLAKQALDESTEIDIPNLLEANVVRIELNGYVTTAPAGKHAHKISVYALISGCEARVRAIVQESLQKLFSGAPIAFRSQLRTILSVAEALPDVAKDYCLIDIARDASIIANIHTGLSMAHKTMGTGLLSIMKRIAGKGMPEETLALLRMASDETCSSGACAAINDATARAEPELVRIFAEQLVELAASRYLPPTLILLCEDALAPWLTGLFSRIDFTQFTTTTRPFNVVPLNAASLRSFATTSLQTPIDQRLLLAAALVHIEGRRA